MIYLLQAGHAPRMNPKQLGETTLWHLSFGVLCQVLGILPCKSDISVIFAAGRRSCYFQPRVPSEGVGSGGFEGLKVRRPELWRIESETFGQSRKWRKSKTESFEQAEMKHCGHRCREFCGQAEGCWSFRMVLPTHV